MKKTITITEEITLKRKRIVEEEPDKKPIERNRGGLKTILEIIKKIILANL